MQPYATISFAMLILCAAARPSAATPDRREEIGTPLIQNYTTKEFGEAAQGDSGQVWSVLRDHRGVMFFGLTQVILEFDGQRWTPIPMPSGPVRGLAIDQKGTIYVALEGDFGYILN